MFFHHKRRWICKELEDFLLSLNPVFYINVTRRINGVTIKFPFRDDDGKLRVDPYERDVVDVEVGYMKMVLPIEVVHVGKKGIEGWRFPYVKEQLESFVSRFPKTNWTMNLKQLGEMREKLRTALCNSMHINFIRGEGNVSPSIRTDFSKLSQEEKRWVCDLICNLDSDAVNVSVNFFLDNMNAEQIYNTMDQLALYDAKQEAAANGEEVNELF